MLLQPLDHAPISPAKVSSEACRDAGCGLLLCSFLGPSVRSSLDPLFDTAKHESGTLLRLKCSRSKQLPPPAGVRRLSIQSAFLFQKELCKFSLNCSDFHQPLFTQCTNKGTPGFLTPAKQAEILCPNLRQNLLIPPRFVARFDLIDRGFRSFGNGVTNIILSPTAHPCAAVLELWEQSSPSWAGKESWN